MPSEPGFLAFGSNADEGPAAWRSRDGQTWQYIALPGKGVVSGAETNGSMQLMVGCSGCDGEGDVPGAVSWTSPNGTAWKRHPLSVKYTSFSRVTYVDGRYVALGLTQFLGEGPTVGCGQPVYWTSSDGRAWSASRKLPAGTCGQIRDVALAEGRLIAIGADGLRSADRGMVAWISRDGRSWERADKAPTGADWTGLTADGPGLIAVGGSCRDGLCGAMVWRSSDGNTWTAVPDQEAFRGGQMRDVLAINTLVVAAGASDDLRPVVWTSPDGLSWLKSDLPGDLTDETITGLSKGDARLVAVGSNGHVWLGALRP
jgi:hypothetical protein